MSLSGEGCADEGGKEHRHLQQLLGLAGVPVLQLGDAIPQPSGQGHGYKGTQQGLPHHSDGAVDLPQQPNEGGQRGF